MKPEDKEYYEKKKIDVLERLKPIADLIGIDLDYHAYDGTREYLICDDQRICTNCTSLYGIENEFWGYVFIKKYDRWLGHFEKQTKNVIREYWYDENFKQPYYK